MMMMMYMQTWQPVHAADIADDAVMVQLGPGLREGAGSRMVWVNDTE